MKLLTIGQMALLNHVSEQTLRLYDRLGLLAPASRGENGYRYYDIKQSAVLEIIQYMKSLGFSLKEIRTQL
ncbi:MAG: MerR family transcriptional regulator [Clostridiales bacterium]|nr:MerR family transcriptional regulator [Clostridiales bacterium]